jgi:hypothetical protein
MLTRLAANQTMGSPPAHTRSPHDAGVSITVSLRLLKSMAAPTLEQVADPQGAAKKGSSVPSAGTTRRRRIELPDHHNRNESGGSAPRQSRGVLL